MQTITKILTEKVSAAFEKCGYDKALGTVTASDRLDLCQFQCNGALAAAKTYRKNPAMIAQEVVAKLQDSPLFGMVAFAPPGFINLNVSDAYLAELAARMDADARHALPKASPARKIVIDYGGPNVAKPLHIGHLRSAIIGESVKRIYRFFGNHAVGDVHLGDWGLQMGLIIAGLQDMHPELPYFDERFTGPYPTEPPFTMQTVPKLAAENRLT
mgnify:CR=1 FL=1